MGLAWELPKVEAEVFALGSPMDQFLAWLAPKRWAVAGPKAFLIQAWALLACPMDQFLAWALLACPMDQFLA